MTQRRRGGPQTPIDPAKLRQARAASGLSLAALAAGRVSRAYVHQLEHGHTVHPSTDIVRHLARRLGTTLADLMPDEVATYEDPSTTMLNLERDLVLLAVRVERQARLKRGAGDPMAEVALRLVGVNLRAGARVVGTANGKGMAVEQPTGEVT